MSNNTCLTTQHQLGEKLWLWVLGMCLVPSPHNIRQNTYIHVHKCMLHVVAKSSINFIIGRGFSHILSQTNLIKTWLDLTDSLSHTQYNSHITVTVHTRHKELLTLSCMLDWAPLSSNTLKHSTLPLSDACISAIHPFC